MDELQVKEAVSIAKRYVADLFADEGVVGLGLEEVDYDEFRNEWRITLGLSRSQNAGGLGNLLAAIGRQYKVVTIDSSRKVRSVKNREAASAA